MECATRCSPNALIPGDLGFPQTGILQGVRSGGTDLFVTNFEGEANNLYMQREGGFFEDAITGTGLMAPGIPYVGWGTQFIDADNDRELDLVVANGHVADFGVSGVQYQMPTQLFRNTGHGRFALLPPSQTGPLFDRQVLGRSIAIVDWNRDQKPDFVQSSIASPVTLATNDKTTSIQPPKYPASRPPQMPTT